MKLTVSRETLHYTVYLYSLALMACCLPLSRYLLSIAQIILVLNWLIEGRFRDKYAVIIRKPAILLFASVFLLYAAGLLYTQNMSLGIMKVKNALPLLLFPLVIGTSKSLPVKNIKWLLLLFSGAVMTASVVCVLNFFINGMLADGDFRSISIFMLHIRFSLMVVMAILILLYLSFYSYFELSRREKLLSFSSAFLLIIFLIFLRSFTGIMLFTLLVTALIVNAAFHSQRPVIRYALLLIVTGFFITTISLVAFTYIKNFHAAPVNPSTLDKYTVNGNPYFHNLQTGALENGHYIDLYICEPELKNEWNKLSRISYDSLDLKGQPINGTIKRYLTSKGLRKDSAALYKLTATDIQSIEKGLANHKFKEDQVIKQRLYETLWEIHIMVNTGFVKQHSLGQRIAFVQRAQIVFGSNRWTGVGTGDVYDSMLAVEKAGMPAIDPLWEGKPHNQYVFFMLAFGILGFLWITWCWLFPVIVTKAFRSLLFNLFAGIIMISMFAIDTIESYDSMVFFAYFYCLFVFGSHIREIKKPDHR